MSIWWNVASRARWPSPPCFNGSVRHLRFVQKVERGSDGLMSSVGATAAAKASLRANRSQTLQETRIEIFDAYASDEGDSILTA